MATKVMTSAISTYQNQYSTKTSEEYVDYEQPEMSGTCSWEALDKALLQLRENLAKTNKPSQDYVDYEQPEMSGTCSLEALDKELTHLRENLAKTKRH